MGEKVDADPFAPHLVGDKGMPHFMNRQAGEKGSGDLQEISRTRCGGFHRGEKKEP